MAGIAKIPAWKPGKNPERFGASTLISRSGVVASSTLSPHVLDGLVDRGILPSYRPDYSPNLVLFDTAILDELFAWAADNVHLTGKPGETLVDALAGFKVAR